MSKKPSLAASALALAVSTALAQSSSDSKYQLAYLDPVVVTANRTEELRSSASVVVDVISRDVIENSGASNITEFLDLLPGVIVSRSYGRLGVDANVDVGYLGESGGLSTLVLIDGQRLNPFDSASVRFAQVPVSAIDRIEVRKAGGGVLYGDRAQGGVINIITRSGHNKDVNVSLGSYGYKKLDTYLGFGSGDFFGNVSAMHAESAGYRKNSSADQNSGRLNLGLKTDAGLITFSARTYNERADLPSFLTIDQFKSDPRQVGAYPGQADRSGNSFGLKFDQMGRDQTGLVVDFLGQTSNAKSSDAYGSTEIQNKRWSFLPEYRLVWGRTRVTIGADIVRVEANADSGKLVSQDSQSVFGQLTHTLDSRVVLDFGIRRQTVQNEFQAAPGGDKTKSSDQKSAVSVGARIPLSIATSLRAGVTSGYRFPNADELYFWSWGPYTILGINPLIRPMENRETYIELSHKTTSGTLSAHFRNIRTHDEIGLATGCTLPAGGTAECNANLYDTDRNVLSLSAAQRINPSFSITAAVDLVDARIASGVNNGQRIPLTPRNVYRFSAEHKMSEWSLLGLVHSRGQMVVAADPDNAQPRIPGRILVDLGLRSKHWGGFSFAAWVRNLTDKSYFDYAAWDGWSTLGVYPADRRSFEMTAKYRF